MSILISTFLFFITQNAHAAIADRIFCSSQGVSDAGFEVLIEKDRTAAYLNAVNFFGTSNQPREFDCVRLKMKTPVIPDAMHSTLQCTERNANDGGLIITLLEGGFVFHKEARVETSSIIRGKEVRTLLKFGRLNCQ